MVKNAIATGGVLAKATTNKKTASKPNPSKSINLKGCTQTPVKKKVITTTVHYLSNVCG